jgi:hypothetical protein
MGYTMMEIYKCRQQSNESGTALLFRFLNVNANAESSIQRPKDLLALGFFPGVIPGFPKGPSRNRQKSVNFVSKFYHFEYLLISKNCSFETLMEQRP